MVYCVSDIHGKLLPSPDPHRDPHGKNTMRKHRDMRCERVIPTQRKAPETVVSQRITVPDRSS